MGQTPIGQLLCSSVPKERAGLVLKGHDDTVSALALQVTLTSTSPCLLYLVSVASVTRSHLLSYLVSGALVTSERRSIAYVSSRYRVVVSASSLYI